MNLSEIMDSQRLEISTSRRADFYIYKLPPCSEFSAGFTCKFMPCSLETDITTDFNRAAT